MDKKFFPIKTATACQSKWTWSTIYLNQLSSASCHRVTPIKFELDDFDNFHNLPEKIRQREAMLRGEWPGMGCEYCRDIEQAGGFSDRQHNLEIPGLTPPELDTNPTATHVTPRIVEIFAQNTCNFSCVYCNPNLSSKIEAEQRKFGSFAKKFVAIPSIPKFEEASSEYFDKFLLWLDKNLVHLKRLHLLGGETFIQNQLMETVLSAIERNPNPELELGTFSNLNAPDKLWDEYISRITDLQRRGYIKQFDLIASIDCWGPEQEYTRYGIDLDLFERRFTWAAEQGDWLKLNINQTVTAMTMRTMPEMISRLKQYEKHKHIGHYFQFYTGIYMYQHPKIFAYEFWKDDFRRIYEAMPKETTEHHEAILRMQGLEKLLQQSTSHNYREIENLQIFLDEIDRRRGLDWRKVFPYLDIHAS